MKEIILLMVFSFIAGIMATSIVWGIVDSAAGSGESSYCYYAIDNTGREYASETPVYVGDIGLYWDRPDAWGVVTDAAGLRVDKNCLRQRGVEVPK